MVKFIADIGSNANTLQQALESIYQAKKAGADIVKFQLFSEHDLYGEGSKERKIQEWLPQLAMWAEELGVEFGCTAFSCEGVAIVDPYVKAHKIASSCATHLDLIKTVDKTDKDIYLSVGACTCDQVRTALQHINFYRKNVTVLYCPAAYPSRYCDVRKMNDLKSLLPWRTSVGFSDHTTDIINAPALAAQLGASVIEKHFTAFPDMATPDRGHSLTPSEFHEMVMAVIMKPAFGPTPEEQEFRKYHQARYVEGKGYVRARKP